MTEGPASAPAFPGDGGPGKGGPGKGGPGKGGLEDGGDNRARDAGKAASVLLVTGMSGAGKSSALKVLEDIGYEAIDNVPLSLVGSLVTPDRRGSSTDRLERDIAIGVDIRTRDFGVEPFVRTLDQLLAGGEVRVRVLFLDCEDEELRHRYTESRRRHPLAEDRPVTDGIVRERRLVSPLRARADLVLDTTELAPGDFKRILQGNFGPRPGPGMTLFVTSFSYRQGLPREADLVFDVRFLANPHYDARLRPLTGLDAEVAEFIAADAGYRLFFESVTGLLMPLIPRYAAEGKSYLTIAVGCTGGRHRSVFVAGRLAAWLEEQGQAVQVRHRDLGSAELR